MLSKIAITVLILFAIWLVFFRRSSAGAGRPPAPRLKALQATRCPECGVFRLPGRPCACREDRQGE